VVEESEKRLPAGNNRTKISWLCTCDCGNSIVASTDHLRSGHTRSCGCYLIERIIETKTTHGRNSRKHKIDHTLAAFKDMHTRCYNKNRKDWKNYGGRGIIVCERWLRNFENFLADMGECPEGHSVERENVNGIYEPSNCNYIPKEDQAKNRRDSVRLSDGNIERILSDWMRILQVSSSFIEDRLAKGIEFPEIVRQAKEYRLVKHWHEDLMEEVA
jgi:hypothetical protein